LEKKVSREFGRKFEKCSVNPAVWKKKNRVTSIFKKVLVLKKFLRPGTQAGDATEAGKNSFLKPKKQATTPVKFFP